MVQCHSNLHIDLGSPLLERVITVAAIDPRQLESIGHAVFSIAEPCLLDDAVLSVLNDKSAYLAFKSGVSWLSFCRPTSLTESTGWALIQYGLSKKLNIWIGFGGAVNVVQCDKIWSG